MGRRRRFLGCSKGTRRTLSEKSVIKCGACSCLFRQLEGQPEGCDQRGFEEGCYVGYLGIGLGMIEGDDLNAVRSIGRVRTFSSIQCKGRLAVGMCRVEPPA